MSAAMKLDAERAAFETAYAHLNNSTPNGGWSDFSNGRYCEEDVHDAWILWQAARATPPQSECISQAQLLSALPELPKHPEKYHVWTELERKAIEAYGLLCRQSGDAADRRDAKRLVFAMQDIDSFGNLTLDKYDYAIKVAAENCRDEPTAEDELNGIRMVIDAAIAQHKTVDTK